MTENLYQVGWSSKDTKYTRSEGSLHVLLVLSCSSHVHVVTCCLAILARHRRRQILLRFRWFQTPQVAQARILALGRKDKAGYNWS